MPSYLYLLVSLAPCWVATRQMRGELAPAAISWARRRFTRLVRLAWKAGWMEPVSSLVSMFCPSWMMAALGPRVAVRYWRRKESLNLPLVVSLYGSPPELER